MGHKDEVMVKTSTSNFLTRYIQSWIYSINYVRYKTTRKRSILNQFSEKNMHITNVLEQCQNDTICIRSE